MRYSRPENSRFFEGCDRRQFIFGGALLTTSGVALALAPKRRSTRISDISLEAAIPENIGGYRKIASSGLVVPPEDQFSRRVYDQVLTRVYGADGHPSIMLLIAYGSAEDGALTIHRPDSCYAAAGYAVSPSTPVELSGPQPRSGAASLLSATLDGRTEWIYFWTRVGSAFPSTSRQERLEVLKANFSGALPDGILVRLSIVTDDPRLAKKDLMNFNADLLESTQMPGHRLLLGPTL